MPIKKRPLRGKSVSRLKSSPRKATRRLEPKMDVLHRRPFLGYAVLTLVLMSLVWSLDKVSFFFKASILESQIEFEGTTLPVKEVPNWVKTGGKNDRAYGTYKPTELIQLMRYDPRTLANDGEDNASINAKITYTVPYLGNYQFDHQEGVGSHLGVDIRIPEGTPVYAVSNGLIEKAQPDDVGGFGKHVVLKVPNARVGKKTETLYIGYGHLSEVKVDLGDFVKKGDLIGYSGRTGTATTPHLHFQIDNSRAPFHMYWPFTSAEAKAAGYSFFDAINAGLGLERAKENTLNPLLWVQENLDGTAPSLPEETEEPEENDHTALARLELTAEETRVSPGETVSFSLEAQDTSGRILRELSGSAKLTISDPEIEKPVVKLSKGKANFEIEAQNPGRVKFTVEMEDVRSSTYITVEEGTPDDDEGSSSEIPESETGVLESLTVTSSQSFVMVGDEVGLTFTALDQEGNKISSPDFQGGIPLRTESGRLEPAVLKASDFENGSARVIFIPSEEGKAVISFSDFGEYEVEVISELKPASAFRVESDGGYILNVPHEITVSTVDEEGNFTPMSFFGTARITFKDGEGIAKTPELTSKDFIDGKATVSVVITAGERVRVKVQSGMLVGEVRLSEEKGKIFEDVDTNDGYAEAIEFLKEQNIVGGYPDGTFRPEQTIVRAEAAKMLLEAFRIPLSSSESALKDVPSAEWFAPYVATAEKKNIVTGYPDRTFRPSQTINTAEFFKILLETSDAPLSDSGRDPCTDVSSRDWFSKYFSYAKNNDLLNFGQKCYPDRAITRGEVAEAMYRVLR